MDQLILDEFGYLTLDSKVGPVLYEIVTERYEHRSVGITTNLVFSDWPPWTA